MHVGINKLDGWTELRVITVEGVHGVKRAIVVLKRNRCALLLALQDQAAKQKSQYQNAMKSSSYS